MAGNEGNLKVITSIKIREDIAESLAEVGRVYGLDSLTAAARLACILVAKASKDPSLMSALMSAAHSEASVS